jgi:predicted MarR family transcription regulator
LHQWCAKCTAAGVVRFGVSGLCALLVHQVAPHRTRTPPSRRLCSPYTRALFEI